MRSFSEQKPSNCSLKIAPFDYFRRNFWMLLDMTTISVNRQQRYKTPSWKIIHSIWQKDDNKIHIYQQKIDAT